MAEAGHETSPSDTRPDPTTWPAVFWRTISSVAANPRRTAISAGVLLILIIGLRILGVDVLCSGGRLLWWAGILKNPPECALPQGSDLTSCLKRASDLKRDYAIESVAMMVQLDDSAAIGPDATSITTSETSGFLLARFRIVYTLRALRNLNPNTYQFYEKYSSSYATDIRHWYGADKEILTGTGREFDVLPSAKKGEVRTVITGADYVYKLPLLPGRNPHRELITLGPREEFFQYDNEEDVICKATIIVSSVDIPLRAGANAARRLKQDRTVDNDEALLSPTNPVEGAYRSVSYHWTNVLPKEIVGVYVTW